MSAESQILELRRGSLEDIDVQTFPRVRIHSVVGAIFNIALTALALYVVFFIGYEGASAMRRGEIAYFGSIFVLAFSGISLPLILRAIAKRDNAILVNREGVLDQLAINGVIPWTNIVSARQLKPGSDTSSLSIKVRDRNAYYKNPLTRYLGYGSPNEIFLFAWGLKSSNELCEKINSIAAAVNQERKI